MTDIYVKHKHNYIDYFSINISQFGDFIDTLAGKLLR